MSPDEHIEPGSGKARATATSAALESLVRRLGVHQPTDEQARIIEYPLSVCAGERSVAAPLLVVAGAGSGKTETMSLRAVYLAAECDVQEEHILGLTFTRKAAAELATRLTERLAQVKHESNPRADLGILEFEASPQASTYNAFALDVVREFGPQLGMRTDFAHLDAAASWQLMYDVVDSWQGALPTDLKLETVADHAISLRESIVNQGLNIDQARRSLARLEDRFEATLSERSRGRNFLESGLDANRLRLALLEVIKEFERRKADLGRYDFADQVTMAARIVAELPSARRELRQRHRVVFLDEFQDTSVVQMRFLATLFADHPVTAVGDPNQAIYGWRGASAASLDDFHSLFTPDPQSPRTTLTLSTAWRNPVSVLDVANQVAEPLRRRPDWDAQAEPSVPSPVLQPRPGASDGEVSFGYAQTQKEEIEQIVSFLAENYAAVPPGGKRPTAAVLCRIRQPIQPIIEACRRAGIPAETGGEDGLLLHPVVLDHRAALEIAHDIGKSGQILRLITNLDLGAKDLWVLGELARQISKQHERATPNGEPPTNRAEPLLLEAVDYLVDVHAGAVTGALPAVAELTQAARSRLASLGGRLRQVRAASSWPVVEQIENVRKAFDSDAQALALGDAGDVTEVLDTFSETAASYQDASPEASVPAFLAWLDVAEDKERGLALPAVEPNPNAVQVMTVHAAKGLEWDLVVVPDLVCSKFPNYNGARIKEIKDPDKNVVAVESPAVPAPQYGWWKAANELPYTVREDSGHLPPANVWDPDAPITRLEAGFKEEVGAYLFAEERRLAYVAFTRPKQKLLLTGAWYAAAKTPRYPSPYYLEAAEAISAPPQISACPLGEAAQELLAATDSAQFPVRPGKIREQVALSASMVQSELDRIRSGSESEFTPEQLAASLPDQNLVATVRVILKEMEDEQKRAVLTESQRARLQVMTGRDHPGAFTTTQLAQLGTREDVWLNLRRPLPDEPFAGSALGTAFHEWVESHLRLASATSSDEEPVSTLDLGTASAPSRTSFEEGLTEEERHRLGQLRRQFQRERWLDEYRVEALEAPFATDLGGLLVRGRVDAVFRHKESNGLLLVDWKTGRAPSLEGDALSESDEMLQRYAAQLEVYKRVWQRKMPGSHILAQLVFVSPEETKAVTLEQLQEKLQEDGKSASIADVAKNWSEQFLSA